MGARSQRVPERMRVACRRLRPRTELARLVRPTQATEIDLNLGGQASGKGFYICRSVECLTKLEKDKRLRKNFSAKLTAPALQWLTAERQRLEEEETQRTPASCSEEVKDL